MLKSGAEDLFLMLEEALGNIPAGRWITECKAYYPGTSIARADALAESIQRQFFSRLQSAIARNASLDFVYLFRGQRQSAFIEVLLDTLRREVGEGNWWARIDDIVVESAWRRPDDQPLARIIIEHADLPMQELEATVRTFKRIE